MVLQIDHPPTTPPLSVSQALGYVHDPVLESAMRASIDVHPKVRLNHECWWLVETALVFLKPHDFEPSLWEKLAVETTERYSRPDHPALLESYLAAVREAGCQRSEH